MKEIIQAALREAEKLLEDQIPKTKLVEYSRRVDNMTILEISEAYPEIPDTASLQADRDGTVVLSWNVLEPVNDRDIQQYKIKRFPSISWQFVYRALVAAGYKRVGFSSSLLKPFDGICLYAMYKLGNFDFFVSYYSFRFIMPAAK